MAFTKTNFVDNQTVIDADTLNAIQDELIRVGGLLGKDIQSATIDNSGHLILTLTDGTTLDAGVAKGSDGITPHIGDNGNWYIGSTDTGKPSKGEQGPGAEVFYIDLEGSYPNYTCPVAMADINAAYDAGKVLKCRCSVGNITETLPLVALLPFGVGCVFSTGGALSMLEQKPTLFTVAITIDGVLAEETEVVKQDNNLKFPNPNALTIKIGSTIVTYDGSSAQTVEIADGTEVSY